MYRKRAEGMSGSGVRRWTMGLIKWGNYKRHFSAIGFPKHEDDHGESGDGQSD